MNIAIVGGTGREGRGLALRWARAGHQVRIGSRDAERAKARAAELGVAGGNNAWAVADAEVVVLTVPYAAHRETLTALRGALQGKVLIDLTVPLRPPAVTRVSLPAGGAAALEGQALLGVGVPVVAALHHVSSAHLAEADRPLEGDVLVCSDSDDARARAIQLIGKLGARALDAGPLANAVALESLTPVLLHLSKRYKTHAAIKVLL
jgi:hypothetical protein